MGITKDVMGYNQQEWDINRFNDDWVIKHGCEITRTKWGVIAGKIIYEQRIFQQTMFDYPRVIILKIQWFAKKFIYIPCHYLPTDPL